jgi:hypothetical protein
VVAKCKSADPPNIDSQQRAERESLVADYRRTSGCLREGESNDWGEEKDGRLEGFSLHPEFYGAPAEKQMQAGPTLANSSHTRIKFCAVEHNYPTMCKRLRPQIIASNDL